MVRHMVKEMMMSALSRISGSRIPSASPGKAYDDIREKVAALVRPDRSVAAAPSLAPLRPSPEEPTPVVMIKADRPDAASRDLGSAFDVLSRATSYFDLLMQKLDQVEGERDEAVSQIDEHKRSAASWQEMIETVQSRMQDAERDLADMRQEIASQQDRANAAEERAAQLENTLKLRDRRLSDVEKQYTNLYDQIMNSFGMGSATYRTLELLVQRFQSKAA